MPDKYLTTLLRLVFDTAALLLSRLSRKAIDTNHCALVQSARNQPTLLARLNLEIHLPPIHMVNACDARDLRAQQCRRQVPQLDFHTHTALIRFQKRLQRLARSPFQQTDQVRRAQHRRHAVSRKINHVLLLDHELQFTGCADFWGGFHRKIPLTPKASAIAPTASPLPSCPGRRLNFCAPWRVSN